MDDLKRREFLKLGGAAVVAGATPLGAQAAQSTAQNAPFSAAPIEMVRIGYVGIGGQGSGHVRNLLGIPGCRITAVCDVRPERTEWATKQITAAGHPAPTAYTRGPRDFERLCETEQLDLVYNATPWEFHVPIMLAAMKNGKHTATEVPAAMTVDDCWAMVEAAEKLQKHCVLMENCNYDRMEMMVYNMVRQGLFGEILHAEGGYLHDSAIDQVRRHGRRALAPRLGDEGQRQPVSDARARADRQLPRHQSRRPVRLSGVDERTVTRASSVGGRAHAGGLAQAPGAVRPRRRQRQPDQDSPRPDDRCRALHEPAAPLQPHPHGSRHEGSVPGLSEPRATSKDAARRTSGRKPPRSPSNSSIRSGRISPSARRAPVTAAWITSRTTA